MVRISLPRRTKEWPASSEPVKRAEARGVGIRSQKYSSIRIRARRIGSTSSTKCRASRMPYASAESMPYCLAKA